MRPSASLAVVLGSATLLAFVYFHKVAYDVRAETQPERGRLRVLKAKLEHAGKADSADDKRDGHKNHGHEPAHKKLDRSDGHGKHGHKPAHKKSHRAAAKKVADDDRDGKNVDHTARRKHTASRVKTHKYDEKGWHLKANDFVTRLLHPDELQPFWLQPILFGIRLIFTMAIFGFSLHFSKPVDNRFIDTVTYIGKVCSQLLFILIALEGYWIDLRLFMESKQHLSMGQSMGTFLIIWCTSANYVACRAVWGSLQIENPVTLLGVIPKYPEIPLTTLARVPLYPGAAKWLSPLKHIYAKILMPYFLPCYFVNACQTFVTLIWCCCTKCVLCFNSMIGCCHCSCALFGTILTLGLVASTKAALSYWWGLEQPLYVYVLIQIWSSFISPFLFAIIFGLVLCASMTSIRKGLVKGFVHSPGRVMAFRNEPQAILEESDVRVLKEYNADILVDFEAFAKIPAEDLGRELKRIADETEDSKNEGSKMPTPGDQPEELEDSKIQIFVVTLINMSSIAFEQLLLIFLVRALNGPADYDSYIGALKLTITERSWASYSSHLISVIRDEAFTAVDYLQKAAETFNLAV